MHGTGVRGFEGWGFWGGFFFAFLGFCTAKFPAWEEQIDRGRDQASDLGGGAAN